METEKIHKTAVVHPEAKLGQNVTIGPYTVIGANVTVGDNCRVGNNCVLDGQTTIGKNCQIFTGAIIGSAPQDKKYSESDDVELIVGDNNVIREYVTMNSGTIEGGRKTIIGNNNLFMVNTHVAHDCIVANNCVLANVGTLAGHVTTEDNAIVGGLSAVHQFVRLGRLSIIGGCSKVVQDIPPFSMCDGHPAKVFKLNTVGLERAKIPIEAVRSLKLAFKILFHSGLTKTHAIEQILKDVPPCAELDHLIFFAKTTKRGLCS